MALAFHTPITLNDTDVEQALRDASIDFVGLDNGKTVIPIRADQPLVHVANFLLHDAHVSPDRVEIIGGSGYKVNYKKYVAPDEIVVSPILA